MDNIVESLTRQTHTKLEMPLNRHSAVGPLLQFLHLNHYKYKMIELISELITFLSKDALRVDEVVAKVGTVASDPAIPLPLEISPALPHVQSAWLARDPASGL